jgi:ABC-type methionine transport system ATPase subunit
MSNLSVQASPEKVRQSLDINIPQQLHQEPVLAKLIKEYDLVVTFKAAVLDQKATGGGWFSLNLEGHPLEITKAIEYLQNLGIKTFSHPPVLSVNQPIDRLLTNYDL